MLIVIDIVMAVIVVTISVLIAFMAVIVINVIVVLIVIFVLIFIAVVIIDIMGHFMRNQSENPSSENECSLILLILGMEVPLGEIFSHANFFCSWTHKFGLKEFKIWVLAIALFGPKI